MMTNNDVLQGSRYVCNQNTAVHVYLLGVRMVLTGAKETFHTDINRGKEILMQCRKIGVQFQHGSEKG